MTSRADLTNVGFAPLAAQVQGLSNIAITAAGTTTANATVCDPQNNVFSMTATGSDGIRMNDATPLLTPMYVVNPSGSTGKVYPATGGNINGLGTDTAVSVATTKAMILMRITSTTWVSNLSA